MRGNSNHPCAQRALVCIVMPDIAIGAETPGEQEHEEIASCRQSMMCLAPYQIN